jgi:hypothetical protein
VFLSVDTFGFVAIGWVCTENCGCQREKQKVKLCTTTIQISNNRTRIALRCGCVWMKQAVGMPLGNFSGDACTQSRVCRIERGYRDLYVPETLSIYGQRHHKISFRKPSLRGVDGSDHLKLPLTTPAQRRALCGGVRRWNWTSKKRTIGISLLSTMSLNQACKAETQYRGVCYHVASTRYHLR